MNTQQDLNSSSSTPHIPLYEKLLKPKIVLPIILAALLAMNYEMVDNYEKLEELK